MSKRFPTDKNGENPINCCPRVELDYILPIEIHYELGERDYIFRRVGDRYMDDAWTLHQAIGAGIFTDEEMPFVDSNHELPTAHGTFKECMAVFRKAVKEYI